MGLGCQSRMKVKVNEFEEGEDERRRLWFNSGYTLE